MSACREFRDDLSAHLDGALDPAAEAALKEHLARCGACREALDGLRGAVAKIRALEPVEPPPWLAERILARVGPARGRWTRVLTGHPQLQAAALVLVCFTGLLLYRVTKPRSAVPPPAVLPQPPAAEREAPPAAAPRRAVPRAAPKPPSAPGFAPPPEAAPAPPGPSPDLEPFRMAAPAAGNQDRARPRAMAEAARKAIATPLVTFRLEPAGAVDAAGLVQDAVLRCGGQMLSFRPGQALVRMDTGNLPALRTALEKAGRVEASTPPDLPPAVNVAIFW